MRIAIPDYLKSIKPSVSEVNILSEGEFTSP
jgi:hypothetical protein